MKPTLTADDIRTLKIWLRATRDVDGLVQTVIIRTSIFEALLNTAERGMKE